MMQAWSRQIRTRYTRSGLATVAVLGLFCCSISLPGEEKGPKASVYDFSLVDATGKAVPLSTYKGKILLIVNLASKSTYRDQIASLNELQKTYGPQGLVVIGVPSDEFGGKELKEPTAAAQYYKDTLHVGFPVFAPAKLHGVETIPLYQFLCDPKLGPGGGDIHWNFTKFIIDRDGQPLERDEVGRDPADVDFHLTIEKALAGKLKAKKAEKSEKVAGDDEDDE
jgi:glutathione peroxidase